VKPSQEPERFSEREFYRQEFRGRTMGITVPDLASSQNPTLHDVLEELVLNGTRVILVAGPQVPRAFVPYTEVPLDTPRLEGAVWRALQQRPGVVVRTDGDLAKAALHTAVHLGLFKLVRISSIAGVRDETGRRRSFADLAELEQLLASTLRADDPQRPLLREVEGLLRAGVPCVNICQIEGLGDELFSYSGSGTLFTRERYVNVRRFGIEDYDGAADLIARGTADGYLAPRSEAQIDALLADGFGAFAGGQHLAGIGALRVAPGAKAGEVASLYTLTRFAGGGVGSHLVTFAIDEARALGLQFAYACTTFERVGEFFCAQGFQAVGPDAVPEEKWRGYDEARRARVMCFRYDLKTGG
jgi:N-acetylglutamate synthase-like GNAT family acetyltransferase